MMSLMTTNNILLGIAILFALWAVWVLFIRNNGTIRIINRTSTRNGMSRNQWD